MGFFDFLHSPNINEGVKEYQNTAGAVLLDVRTEEEYEQGHIPNSINVPLGMLSDIEHTVETNTPLFVYCHSGARSSQAVAMLKQMGYETVKNIGGIASYQGKVEY